MPARTRHGPSVGAEVAEPEEARGKLSGLKFNQPLSWRVGRSAIPIADLLERLQTLAHELRNLEQEEVDKNSFRKVSQELASGHLLAHKDKGVRAWTACCLVDVLRLCAPDAPFTGNQLKDIFTCIVTSIIPALADPSNAYNAQHVYVLNSLAEVKSIVLVTDLDHPDSLIIPLFAACFDIVSGSSKASTGEQVAKNVEFDMTRMLVTIIDETPVLAPEVVDIIVAQFLRVDPRALEPPNKKGRKTETPHDARQDTLLLKDYPPAYNMAKSICQACPERMTSHISQYFNNVIVDSSKSSTTGRDSFSKHSHKRAHLDDSDEETEDIKELGKAHRLIRELWRACPEVLQNVVPQLEAELSAESVPLRLLATQTIGDLAAGIGVAGPPPSPPMDPARYPPVTLADYSQTVPQPTVLHAPLSPKPFSQVHASAYDNFLSRHLDKSASVRAAWVTVVGRILLTSAGGCGLSENEEQSLFRSIAALLRDADEKVRVAAADTVGAFGLSDIVQKLAVNGDLSSPNSVLSVLAERVKDRKTQVREHAIKILARIWGAAAGEIEQQNEQVVSLLKDAPSKILDAYYTNDTEIHVLVDRVLFELLLPLTYPPIKTKSLSTGKSSQSQNQKDSQNSDGGSDGEADIDRIRVRRILTLLACLDDKAKKVFFAMQHRQLSMRTVISVYLQHCEAYNGGVMDDDESRIKSELGSVINSLAKIFPDPSRASADLWKFAKVHDRRSYQLIRFAMAANSDYRTVTKAIRELTRRIQAGNNAPLLETLTPIIYRCSSLVFNRSHIPAIMSISRSDERGLANPAHELLKEISSRNPEVLEAQVHEMCKDLETQAPKATDATASTQDAGTEEILKACSGFAKRLPSKLPKDRKFLQALANYALYSPSPRAAKHAVSILMVAADRKEMYARDLVHSSVTKWEYGSDFFLTRLAALSQLNLLAPREADEVSDTVISIAANQVLLTNRSAEPDSGYAWSEEVCDETTAKEWALKIIVNRLRAKEGSDNDDDFRAHAIPVYNTLIRLVTGDGELSKKKDTPATQKSRLRLLAARLLLKLCASNSLCEKLFSPENFNSVSLVAQDPLLPVRGGFVNQLIKKLMAQRTHLSNRWYTVPFLLAFEPNAKLKNSTFTWLRARVAFFSQHNQISGRKNEQQMIMESVFSRLLSLLAYHPDYPSAELDERTKNGDLADLSRYILFYLSAVANEHNLSLIFHIAQRVKQARDGITKSDEISNRLHTLSDLAQATIRRFADAYSQMHKFGGGGAAGGTNILQTYPGRLGIPSSIFSAMGSHREAQDVADKNFLPDAVDDLLDGIVRSTMKPPKNGVQGSGHGGQTKKRKSGPTETNGVPSANASKKSRRNGEKPTVTRPRKTSSATAGPGSTKTGTGQKRRKKSDENEDAWSSSGEGASGARVGTTTTTTTTTATTSRRRSSRGTGKKEISYADQDSDEDDMEMQEWDQKAETEREERAGEDNDDDAEDEEEKEAQADDEEEAPVTEKKAAKEDNKNIKNNRTEEGKEEDELKELDRELDTMEDADSDDDGDDIEPNVSRQQQSATKTKKPTAKTATEKKKKAEPAAPTRRSSRRNR